MLIHPLEGFASLTFSNQMFCFLRTIIPSCWQTSPSSSQHSLPHQTHFLPFTVRFCTSTPSNSNDHSFTVSYLIHTCGLSPQEAASASKYVTFDTPHKPDLVINFLNNLGFSKSQILRFTRAVPHCLSYDPHKTLQPKIDFFKSRGISSSDIIKLLCSCPNIMRRSLNKQLIPSFDFFRGLFQSDEHFIKALTRFSGVLLDINTHALPNMKLLREVGVSESDVVKLLQLYPRTITTNTSRFKMIVEELEDMEFDPSKFQFVMGVYALSSVSKCTWSKKANVYRKWGWSDEDIIDAFRRCPFCMKISEDKIEAIMEILVDELGCPPSTIPRYAVVMTLSTKKRIIPRAHVLQVLLSKGLVKKKSLLSALLYTEKEFLKRFIVCLEEEGSELMNLYQDKLDLAG